jgi:hypothetical protein
VRKILACNRQIYDNYDACLARYEVTQGAEFFNDGQQNFISSLLGMMDDGSRINLRNFISCVWYFGGQIPDPGYALQGRDMHQFYGSEESIFRFVPTSMLPVPDALDDRHSRMRAGASLDCIIRETIAYREPKIGEVTYRHGPSHIRTALLTAGVSRNTSWYCSMLRRLGLDSKNGAAALCYESCFHLVRQMFFHMTKGDFGQARPELIDYSLGPSAIEKSLVAVYKDLHEGFFPFFLSRVIASCGYVNGPTARYAMHCVVHWLLGADYPPSFPETKVNDRAVQSLFPDSGCTLTNVYNASVYFEGRVYSDVRGLPHRESDDHLRKCFQAKSFPGFQLDDLSGFGIEVHILELGEEDSLVRVPPVEPFTIFEIPQYPGHASVVTGTVPALQLFAGMQRLVQGMDPQKRKAAYLALMQTPEFKAWLEEPSDELSVPDSDQ